ncbi:PREDICTED: progressive rod-cone degeneration protein [Miniopterus natalensis]|uniref:progressive rod-cone degeneration protein n=1 Tax=Miniopterus natalensis TaxID=291302 RepID=UPI0007A6E652|nr:PREDICTED: progressive rod-cone degeneration protein [Miniopterus natalensis]
MCTTLFLLSTLAVLLRRHFANRVQPEPSEVDRPVMGSSLETNSQPSGREKEPLGEALTPRAKGRLELTVTVCSAEMINKTTRWVCDMCACS